MFGEWRPTPNEKVICMTDDLYLFDKGKIYSVATYSRVFNQVRVIDVENLSIEEAQASGVFYPEFFHIHLFHECFVSYDNLSEEDKFAFQMVGVEEIL